MRGGVAQLRFNYVRGEFRTCRQLYLEENAVEVEITWGRAVKVWWAYMWRNLIAIIVVAVVAGAVVGFILGFIMGVMGAATSTIQSVAAPVGALIGLGLSVVPMKLILGKDFGQFRLVLVAKE
jgi:hypothetical protein